MNNEEVSSGDRRLIQLWAYFQRHDERETATMYSSIGSDSDCNESGDENRAEVV